MADASVRLPTGNSDLADTFLNVHAPDDWFRQEVKHDDGTHFYGVHPERLNELAESLVDHIACVVAGVLDAGSERDAVNENDDLYRAIMAELEGWTI